MASTSAPLLSALLSILAAIVALTMHAETWRPVPLFAASDRPKFHFGGKRREPEPVDEGPGLLDEVAGGRYGGGQGPLPTALSSPPDASWPPPPPPPADDPGVYPPGPDAPAANGTSFEAGSDDGIVWAPAGGGEANSDTGPRISPSAPLPGTPGWPEMGLLEAIANLPDDHEWDEPIAGRTGGSPATPPLPLGDEPVAPFADLIPPQVWETPAMAPAAPDPWASPAAPSAVTATVAEPADDPDSWHSWQWQHAITSPDDHLQSAPRDAGPADEARRAAAWEAAERGLDPASTAPPAPALSPSPVPESRPSIWAAPAAPVADAWATDAWTTDAWATDADLTAVPPPPPPPPPPPFTGYLPDAPNPPTLSAPPGVAPLEPTWDLESRPELPAPGFSFATTTTSGHRAHPEHAAGPDTELIPVPESTATDEWETLRGAFAGPDDDSASAALDTIDDTDDTDDTEPVTALGDAATTARGTSGDAGAVDEWASSVPDPVFGGVTASSETTIELVGDPWWDAASLADHDPFALELPAPTAEPAAALPMPPCELDGQANDPQGATVVRGDGIDPWDDVLIERLRAVVAPGTGPVLDSWEAAGIESAGADEFASPAPTFAPLPPGPTSTEGPRGTEGQAAPTLETEPSFDSRVERGLRMRLTDDEVVSFLADVVQHIVPGAEVQVLVTDGDGALDRVATAGPGERAGCAVARTDRCPAIAGAETLRFADSTDLDACPHLAGRGGAPCAALCSPLRSGAGVVHVTVDRDAPLDAAAVQVIESAAARAAARLAEVRAD